MEKFSSRRIKNIIYLSSIIGILFLGINYTFCYPTIINQYIATNTYSEPANSYFDDDNFYNCVVDAYNKKNGTSLPYTTNLNDEELKTITRLSCINQKITSAKGIEKLTSLTYLEVDSNQLTSLDVSKNVMLECLTASNNKLTSIDVSKNTALMFMDVRNNTLTSLDMSENTILETLLAYDNQLTNLNVSTNTALTILDVGYNQLTSLDVSNNTILDLLLVYDNQLTSLDVSKNTALTVFDMNYNSFNESLFVYKSDSVIVGNNIKIPSQLGWDNPNWISGNTDIAVVDTIGLVTTLKSGIVEIEGTVSGKYTTTSTINVIEITSNKYFVDDVDEYIYIGNDCDKETIKSHIDVPENIDINIDLDNNLLQVKYGDKVLKEFKLVSISSEVYDLSKGYIYIGAGELGLDNINVTNGSSGRNGNILEIKYGDDVIEEIKLVSISSEVYDLSKGYIYIGAEELDLEDINITNGSSGRNGNMLEIKYEDDVLDELSIISIDFGELLSFENTITVSKDMSYNDFISNITGSDGITYKIFNGNEEVITGTISDNMVLKVYYNDEEIDSYNITEEYLIIDDSIEVDVNNKYLSNIELKTSVNDILGKINTSGEITITNKDNEVIGENNLLGTGSVVTIKLSNETYEYTVVVIGDIDGDSVLKLSDIMKMANYIYKDKSSLNGVYIKAVDFDNNGKYNLQDIMKSAKALYGGN